MTRSKESKITLYGNGEDSKIRDDREISTNYEKRPLTFPSIYNPKNQNLRQIYKKDEQM